MNRLRYPILDCGVRDLGEGMPVPEIVHRLVDRFEDGRKTYLSTAYKEEWIRQDFINPLFEALGWDVVNRRGVPVGPQREVVPEERLKGSSVKGSRSTTAPDYAFRLGGARKFFVEAKKPSVNLEGGISPAFQLRRYAWSAKLPLSILTDFEELATYDCRYEPKKHDGPAVARLGYMTYEEYPDRWDEIASIFSKEAVLSGSLEKYAEETKRKRGTETVDAAFLREIEGWRSALARDLATHNDLNRRQLNYAVQMTIDRIIFLRMAEDRGIEDYGTLLGIIEGYGVYSRLLTLFKQADNRYNSGLFHFRPERDRKEDPDTLTPTLAVSDRLLRGIIQDLYYPESPYEFSVLPVDVLGQVYEQFLGKVIRLEDGHKAVVEEKPEVRKAGGVYYTPTYIVDYIVEHTTVGKLLEGKRPGPRGGASKLKIVDPACGSGSFLIGAYQYLLDWHRNRYLEDGADDKWPKQLYQGPGGEWRLTIDEKKRILLNNIYGVDIDPQAVEVTKLSLLLKVLEGETDQTLESQLRLFQERALPDLDNNIKCGNSLIGYDFYDTDQASFLDNEEMERVNIFDWKYSFPQAFSGEKPGFDGVIGNPPYDVMEKERGAASWPHSALTAYVRMRPEYRGALGGKLNLFRFFVTRSLALLREGGRFGMILPLALLADKSTVATRRHVLLSSREVEADCFPQKDSPNRRIFRDAKLSTAIVVCQRSSGTTEETASLRVRTYPANSFRDPFRESAIRLEDAALLDPKNFPIPLVDARNWAICKKVHSAKRVCRLGEVEDFDVSRGEINQTIYRSYISNDDSEVRLLKGVEVGRYRLNESLSQGEREWLDEKRFLVTHSERPVVRIRRIATQRITGVDERLRVVATIIEPPAYFADSTNSIVLLEGSSYKIEYLLALLNSMLFQWRFKLTSTNNNVATNELDSMPFRANRLIKDATYSCRNVAGNLKT